MLEFALAMPVLLVILYLVIEVANVVFTYNTVVMASREASRYAAGLSQTGSNGLPRWQDCQGIRAAARRVAGYLGFADGDIHIYYDNGPGTAQNEVCNPAPVPAVSRGGRMTVKVTGYYAQLVRIFDFPPLPVSSLSSHTILTDIAVGE